MNPTTETLAEARVQIVRVIGDHPDIGNTWKSWNDADGKITDEDFFYFGFAPAPQFLTSLEPEIRMLFIQEKQYVRLPASMWAAAPAPHHQTIVDGYAAADLPALLAGVRAIAQESRKRRKAAADKAADKSAEAAPVPVVLARELPPESITPTDELE